MRAPSAATTARRFALLLPLIACGACGSTSTSIPMLSGDDDGGGANGNPAAGVTNDAGSSDAGASSDATATSGSGNGNGNGNGSTVVTLTDDAGISYAPYDATVITHKHLALTGYDSFVIAPHSGALESWGEYGYGVPFPFVGQVDGSAVDEPVDPSNPTPKDLTSATSWIEAGGTSCGLRQDGTVWCWGQGALSAEIFYGGTVTRNNNPQTDSDRAALYAPGQIGGSWVSIDSAENVTCGIQSNGSGWCWGFDFHGTRGIGGVTDGGSEPDFNLPTLLDVRAGTQWRAISAGWEHVCGIQIDGTLWCWGSNSTGQLGINLPEVDSPFRIGTASDWDTIAAGVSTTCASRGTVMYCWGNAAPGKGEVLSPNPDLPGGATIFATTTSAGWGRAATEASSMGTCAVDKGGALWCADGIQAGAQVMTTESWIDVDISGWNACAMTSTGLVRCWGSNVEGSMGPNAGPLLDQNGSGTHPTNGTTLPSAVDVQTF